MDLYDCGSHTSVLCDNARVAILHVFDDVIVTCRLTLKKVSVLMPLTYVKLKLYLKWTFVTAAAHRQCAKMLDLRFCTCSMMLSRYMSQHVDCP